VLFRAAGHPRRADWNNELLGAPRAHAVAGAVVD
jgi:hypothetical protein